MRNKIIVIIGILMIEYIGTHFLGYLSSLAIISVLLYLILCELRKTKQ